MWLWLFTAFAADIEAYNAISLPETVDDKALTEAMQRKVSGLMAIQHEVTTFVAGDNPPEAELAQLLVLGQAYEEVGATLIHSTPPLYLESEQAGLYQSMVAEQATGLCSKALTVYGEVLARAEEEPAAPETVEAARDGQARLTLEGVTVPDIATLEREADAWLATWPRATKQAPPPPEPEKRRRKRNTSKLVAVLGPSELAEAPVSEAPPPSEGLSGREQWLRTYSTVEVRACLQARDF